MLKIWGEQLLPGPPPPPTTRKRGASQDRHETCPHQSLRLRITVGISRSLPKSLDAIGPNPAEPSGRVSPLRKNGGRRSPPPRRSAAAPAPRPAASLHAASQTRRGC